MRTTTALDGSKLSNDSITLAHMASGTDGQVITYSAAGDPVAVGPGTTGQVLTSAGANLPQTFADAGGGAWGVKASGTLSGSSGLAVTGLTKTTQIWITGIFGTAQDNMAVRTSSDNGSSYDDGGTDYAYAYQFFNIASNSFYGDAAEDGIRTPAAYGDANNPNQDLSIVVTIFSPAVARYTLVNIRTFQIDTGGTQPSHSECSGIRKAVAAVNAIKVFPRCETISATYTVLELN